MCEVEERVEARAARAPNPPHGIALARVPRRIGHGKSRAREDAQVRVARQHDDLGSVERWTDRGPRMGDGVLPGYAQASEGGF